VQDLSLHILDVVENSLRASAKLVEISVVEDAKKDVLVIVVKDDGSGMGRRTLGCAVNPFFTTKGGKRVGLGLSLLAQAARETGGDLRVRSEPGAGTEVRATFGYSHPDRKPLGDLAATIEALVLGNPGVDFVFEHERGAERIRLDTREMTR
jgi:signal transduction histidine kinase